MKDLLFEPTIHKGEARIKVCFQHNAAWNSRMKKVPGARWSSSMKCWHIPDTAANRVKCKLPPSRPVETLPRTTAINKKAVPQKIAEINLQHLASFIQLLHLKAYSESTIKTYRNEFSIFLQTLGKTDAATLTPKRIKDYLQYCYDKLKLSEHTNTAV